MATTILKSDTGSKLTGRKVLLMFACFFGTIASADAFLVLSAVRTWSGTEATSAYKAGQLYNGELERARAQDARHWTMAMAVEREADGAARVTVDALDGEGRPLAGRVVAAALQRPTDKREDRSLALVEGAAGSYVAVVGAVPPGQWDLVVDVMEGEERAFRRRTRVILR
jgi:nitrogen fixation protein FixH